MERKTQKEKDILLIINDVPTTTLKVRKNNTIGQIKSLISSAFNIDLFKINGKFLANNKSEINVFGTDKFDAVNLSSVWSVMDNSIIYVYTPFSPTSPTNNKTNNKTKEKQEERINQDNKLLGIGKDVIGVIALNLNEKELLNFCMTSKETCRDETFKYYLENNYPESDILRYKPAGQTWKQYFLSFVYYKDILKRLFNRDYTKEDKGDIKQILDDLINRDDINLLFMTAALKGDLESVKYLVNRGADIHYNRDFAFMGAIENGHLNVVKYFLEKGVDINAFNSAPLLEAVKHGRLNIVMYLVESGAEINPWSISKAIEGNYWDIVKYLIEHPVVSGKYSKEKSIKKITETIKFLQKRQHLVDKSTERYLKNILKSIKRGDENIVYEVKDIFKAYGISGAHPYL